MTTDLVALAIAVTAALLAGEVATRLKQPAVLAEILAGVALGPHALGLIDMSEPLHLVAELGAVFLLFEVGLQMNIQELRSVGGSALRVALIGMVVPMALAFPAARMLGEPVEVALFLAAALTATSVGITARVFQEQRMLETPEARTVLAAAVADDVGGLLVLAVTLPLATGAAPDAGGIALTVVGAIGFVVGGILIGVRVLPIVMGIASRARADGAPGVAGTGVALGLAGAAGAIGLAPIVGAFVGGLAVSASSEGDETRRTVQSVARILVPIFFVSIGTQVDATAFTRGSVLLLATALSILGIAGKILAGAGASRGTGDRLLIGLGMVPRGEVGLIFAGLGLSEGVLAGDAHAALVLTVMVTTMVAPPLLRLRAGRPEPLALAVAPMDILDLLRDGDRSAWQGFAQHVNLPTVLPGAGQVLATRLADALRDEHPVPLLDDLRRILVNPYDPAAGVWSRSKDHDLVRVAALAQDTLHGPSAPEDAVTLAVAAGLSSDQAHEIAALMRDRALLPATSERHDATGEETVLDLAAHLASPERADRLYLLAAASLRDHPHRRARLDTLFGLLRSVLSHPELVGREAIDVVEQRRASAAAALTSMPEAAAHLAEAPRAYLLRHEPGTIARHIRMATPRPIRGEIRIEAEPKAGDAWTVHTVALDRPGLLVALTGAIAAAGGQILTAEIATWPDDLAVDVFTVRADLHTDWDAVRLAAQTGHGGTTDAPPDGARLHIDNQASPWHTLVEVDAPDGVGLLQRVAGAFARADVDVHAATIATRDGRAIDRFEVTTRDGGKLTPGAEKALRKAFGERP